MSSTQTPGKTSPATVGQAAGGYSVSRPLGTCAVSGLAIAPGTHFMTALRETDQGLERLDVLPDHWEQLDRGQVLAFWKAVMPESNAKRQLFVDDATLLEVFEKLADVAEPTKRSFRFVLGLILLRKRLLSYESTRSDEQGEWWVMKPRGRDQTLEMFNPQLDESAMAEVAQQLNSVLNETL